MALPTVQPELNVITVTPGVMTVNVMTNIIEKKNMRRIYLISWFTILIAVSCLQAQSGLVEGSVTYKSQELIYIDLGTRDGLAVDDTLEIWHGQDRVGSAIVRQAATKTASCFGINPGEFEAWNIGDKVRFHRAVQSTQALAEEALAVASDSTATAPFDTLGRYKASSQQSVRVVEARKAETRFFGKLSSRYLGVRNSDNTSANFNQPSVYFNLNVNNISGSNFSGNVLLRGRRRSSSTETESQTRVYSAGLTYEKDNGPIWASVGRIYHPQLGGVGTVDGVGTSLRWNSFQAGALVGFVPVYDSLKIDTKSFKWGISGSFVPLSRNFLATAALMTENKEGGLDRQYVYLSTDYSKWRWLRFSGSAEVDLDLDGITTTRGKTNLSAFYLSSRITPVRGINIVARYTQRQNVKYLISQADTPDSLFDKAFRQGFYGNINFRLPGMVTLGLNGNITNDGSGQSMFIIGMSFRYSSLPTLDGPLNLNVQYFDNLFIRAIRFYPSVDWNLNADVNLSMGYDIYGYMYKSQIDTHLRQTPQLDLYWRLMNTFYVSGSYSAERENGQTISQFMLDLSYRFR